MPFLGYPQRQSRREEISVPTTYLWRHRSAHGRSVAPGLGFGAGTRGDRKPLPEAGSQARETGKISRTTVQAGDIVWPQGRPNPRRHSSESPASPRVALTSWSPSRRKAARWRGIRRGIVIAESLDGDQAGITSQSGVHGTTLRDPRCNSALWWPSSLLAVRRWEQTDNFYGDVHGKWLRRLPCSYRDPSSGCL